MSQIPHRQQAGRAETASCCGTAAAVSLSLTTKSSACCGDPTPDASTGACCSEPAADCSCQTSATTVAPNATGGALQPAAPARLPVAIIGAGPVGLAAAAHLIGKGETAPVVADACGRSPQVYAKRAPGCAASERHRGTRVSVRSAAGSKRQDLSEERA